MLVDVEKINKQNLKCIFNVPYNKFEKTKSKVFIKTREKYKIPGMETGKIPRTMVESYYGETVLYEDTINYLIEEEFRNMSSRYKKHAITENMVKDINILQLEKGKNVKFELIIEHKGDER